jgi:spore maturation protein CgeB
MKVLLVSTFEFGAYSHVIKHTLNVMGHEVYTFDHVNVLSHNYSDIGELDKQFKFMCDAVNPDLIFIIKGRGISPSVIKEQSAKKVLWWTDSITRFSDFDNYVNAVDKAYCMEEGQGFPWIPVGIDESFHRPYYVKDEKAISDVIFVGTGHYNRTEYVFKIMSGLRDYNLAIWGNDWPPSPIVRGKAIYELDLMAVYTGSKIILNKHYIPGITPNMRSMEAPASGTMVLSDSGNGLRQCFKEGTEFVAYKNDRDARYLARKYLQEPEERMKIAKAGFDRVRKDHQLSDRLVKMFK